MFFVIDSDNVVTCYPEQPTKDVLNSEDAMVFSSEKEFTAQMKGVSASRLIEVWNSFAGVVPFDDLKPVRKFTNLKTGISRIWKAVQRLATETAPAAKHAANVSPKQTAAGTTAADKTKAKDKAVISESASKKEQVLAMLRTKNGATLATIVETTGWQKHTVRGFISTLPQKAGVEVESFKNENKERAYRIN